MSGRLKHRRLGGKDSQLSVGASCRLSNKDRSLWNPPRSKCHVDQSKAHRPWSPLASPQVAQTRKHSVEVRIAEPRTPYKFPLILAPARLTAVSVLEGQDGHSSHRGQASCRLPSKHSHEKCILQRQLSQPLLLLSSWNSTPKWSYFKTFGKF